MKVLKKIVIVNTLLLSTLYSFSQTLLTEIPNSGKFTPEVEQIESLEDGISIYDQYATLIKSPKIRKNGSIFLQGKIEDHYNNGRLLHKGTYENGVATSFTNYYLNETVERKYKHKKGGNGTLTTYYINGNKRKVVKYNNYLAYEITKFSKEEGIVYIQELNPETGTPELIQENYNNGIPKSIMELQDPVKMSYMQLTFAESGKKLTEGKLEYSEDDDGLIKKGEWLQYDKDDNPSPLEYDFDEVISYTGEIINNNESEEEEEEEEEETANNDDSSGNTNTAKSAQAAASTMPSNLVRFDKDADNEISTGELDIAVSDFFDDTTIELDQINSLVNFFFDQE